MHKTPIIMGGLRDNTYNLDCNRQSYYSTMALNYMGFGEDQYMQPYSYNSIIKDDILMTRIFVT